MLSGRYRKRPMTRNESNRILSESLLQIFKVWTYKTYLKRSRSRTSISTIFEIKRWDLHDEFRYQLDKCQIIRHSNTSNQSSHLIFSIGENFEMNLKVSSFIHVNTREYATRLSKYGSKICYRNIKMCSLWSRF